MSAPILVIRLFSLLQSSKLATPEDPVEWVLFQDGEPLGPVGKGIIGDLKGLLQEMAILESARIVALIPAEDVVMTRVKVPLNQKRQRDKLVPYILEEHLNQNVTELFFATDWLTKSNDVGVAYVSKDRLNQWLTLLDEQGIKPDFVYPEHYLLPQQDGQCFAVFDRGRVFVRHDHWTASCAPVSFAADWIERVVEDVVAQLPENGESFRFSLLIDRHDQEALEVSSDCEDRLNSMVLTPLGDETNDEEPVTSVPIQVKRLLVTQSITYILSLEAVRLVTEHQPFQLLQSDFKTARRKRKSKYQWQAAAGLLFAFIALELGYTASSYLTYQKAYEEARVENIELFKSTFPHVTRIRGSIRRALSSELAKGGTTDSNAQFLQLVSSTGTSLADAKGLVIQRMAFDAGQGSLRIDLQVADYPDLEKIQKNIEAQALQVKIDGANKVENGVKARLRIDVS